MMKAAVTFHCFWPITPERMVLEGHAIPLKKAQRQSDHHMQLAACQLFLFLSYWLWKAADVWSCGGLSKGRTGTWPRPLERAGLPESFEVWHGSVAQTVPEIFAKEATRLCVLLYRVPGLPVWGLKIFFYIIIPKWSLDIYRPDQTLKHIC